MDFDATDQLLIRYSVFVRYWTKSGRRSIVQHSNWIWCTYETSLAN